MVLSVSGRMAKPAIESQHASETILEKHLHDLEHARPSWMSLVLDGPSSITSDERYRSSAESPNDCRIPRSRIVVLPIIEFTTASEWLCLIGSDDICQFDIPAF